MKATTLVKIWIITANAIYLATHFIIISCFHSCILSLQETQLVKGNNLKLKPCSATQGKLTSPEKQEVDNWK